MNSIEAALRRPNPDEFNEYYNTYISRVAEGRCLATLSNQVDELESFFRSITAEQAVTLHPPYTWTIKQVVGHLIDTERIFSERLHHFAFADFQPLPGMNQDDYIKNGDYERPALEELVAEMLLLRRANLLLIKRIKPEDFDRRGQASGYDVTVRALAWMLAGHVVYHMEIVRKRLGR
ncbi:MAG: DinB family protein [Pirellulales bacterium]